MVLKVAVVPFFDSPDKGDGGIRRVVEAQKKYLPEFDIEVIDNIENSDIVAIHGAYPLKTLGKPSVLHTHGLYWHPEYEWSDWAHKANNGVISSMKQADIVTSPSKWVARILAKGMWLDSPVLYHGIEPDEWKPGIKDQAYVLWNKTRVDPICEVDTLEELAKRLPQVQFVSTFGPLLNNITHTGRLPLEAAKQYIENASIYLCNTRETFGIGTLEAMACEVPILGWNWGGQREIVQHKVHGWLSQPGDFDDLVRGLHYCLEHREELGKAAREHVLRNFTWRAAMERYAILYKEVHKHTRVDPKTKLKRPKVSVIITCYNLANLLPRAVQSVLVQTMDDYEIIIVNDASPDDTKAVATALAKGNKKIKVINNTENLYLAGALNAGIAVASGKYIVPLDADNELAPEALQLLSEPLDKGWLDVTNATRYHVDITYGSMEVVEEDGKRFISDWPPRTFSYEDQISHKNQISSTSMYRKRIWSRIGGYRRRCRTAEDADFWCRASSFGAVPHKVTDAVTLIYHNRNDSMSHKERDWAWHDWYKFGSVVPPFGAALPPKEKVEIRTDEPARITVVIPVGPNHTELVVDAVDSIVNQTYTKWDVIVVNDSGKEIPWIHPFVKVLSTNGPGGMGPAVARNIGIAASTTPYFILLDADDFLQPEALQLMLEAHVPKSYVYTDWITHESGEIHQTENYNCDDIRRKLPHSVTCLYERAAWTKVGGFDEKISAWEDWDFVIALADAGYCGIRVPVPLLHYRMQAGTVRESKWANKDANKAELDRKWTKYLVNGEPFMACGGCSQKVAPSPPTVLQSLNGNNGQAAAQMSNDLVQVQYVGDQPPRTYRGSTTGTEYRFGQPSHLVKYVYRSDAEMFALRNEFRVMENGHAIIVPSQQLQAAGPPSR